MQIDKNRPPSDEKFQQLRRELLDRIVRNEAQRRTEQGVALAAPSNMCESPAGVGGHNG